MENELSEEIQVEIKIKANEIYWQTHKVSVERDPYCRGLTMFEVAQIPIINGLTEWAQWKVKYDELKAQTDLSSAIQRQCTNDAQDTAERMIKERNELKGRAEGITKEHSDLNLALAAMLNGYQNLSQYQKDWFTVPKDLIDVYTKMVLEYDTNNPH